MTADELRISDWSSDVCSSDLHEWGFARGILDLVDDILFIGIRDDGQFFRTVPARGPTAKRAVRICVDNGYVCALGELRRKDHYRGGFSYPALRTDKHDRRHETLLAGRSEAHT